MCVCDIGFVIVCVTFIAIDISINDPIFVCTEDLHSEHNKLFG